VLPPSGPHPDREPTGQLAYFHVAPIDGEAPEVLARHASFVTLTHGDELYREELRLAGYAGTVLQFIVAAEVNGPGPYLSANEECDRRFRPLRNGVARERGVFCDEIHPHEDWFLHNGAGERLYSVVGDTGVWYHMNPASAGWRAFALQQMVNDVRGPDALGFDGIFLDNVELSIAKVAGQMANSDGEVQEFTTNSQYRAAWIAYLTELSANLRPYGLMWANLIADPNDGQSWAPYLEHLDGGMMASFATGYRGLTAARWNNNLTQVEAAIAAGKGVVAVGLGERDDHDLQAFAFASYLLIAQGTQAYFRYVSGEDPLQLGEFWLYDNYEVTLGAPFGPRFRAGSVWRRDFECGYVEVDPSSRTAEIVQTQCGSAP
jgi:hypothetical protein